MRTTATRTRWAAAGLGLVAALSLGACVEDTTDDVTDPVTDQPSTTPPEETDQGGEEDPGGGMDDGY